MPNYCHDCKGERDPATVSRSPCPGCGSTRVDAVAYAQTAYATATAYPPTVVTTSSGQKHAQGGAVVSARPVTMATGYGQVVEGEQVREVTDELAVQGFYLAWTQLTESPVTWMAQVFDAAGEELTSGVGDDPIELLAGVGGAAAPPPPGLGTLRLKSEVRSVDAFGMRTALRVLACVLVAAAAACSTSPSPAASSSPATSSTASPPPTTAALRLRLEQTTSTTSLADSICAEIQDPAFDARPLRERRFIREACSAEREAEAQAELLEESGALDPPEPPDEAPAYEPDYPEPDYPEPEPENPGYP